jgi:hypothetical protein
MGVDALIRLLGVIDAFLNLDAYILIKCPSQRHIQNLNAPADCKNREILLEGHLGYPQFHPIQTFINLPQTRKGFFTVKPRVDIWTSTQKKTI